MKKEHFDKIDELLKNKGFKRLPTTQRWKQQVKESKFRVIDLDETTQDMQYYIWDLIDEDPDYLKAKDDDLLMQCKTEIDIILRSKAADNPPEPSTEQKEHEVNMNIPDEPADNKIIDINNNTQDINAIVRPVISVNEALESWNCYIELQKKIISQSDIQKIGDRQYKKKSYWRKMATFFNLCDEVIEETKTVKEDSFSWMIKVKCIAPNGRYTIGVAICSSNERKFAHVDHDVYSAAHTRAKNIAISDMIGGGEVSYEEVE